MDCKTIQTKLVEYLEDDLDDIIINEMDSHFNVCNSCKSKLKEYESLFEEIENDVEMEPGPGLDSRFFSALEDEKNRILTEIPHLQVVHKPKGVIQLQIKQLYKVAAAVILLLTGYFAGRTIQLEGKVNTRANYEIQSLKQEINSMRQVVMYSMLKQDSPSKRIKAVNSVTEIHEPDQKLLGTLIKTLNKDDNTNVRIAAARALKGYSNQQFVRQSLVSSLNSANDPALQIELIHILVDIEEKGALAPLRKIINDKNAVELVKMQAQTGIDILM